MPVPHAPQALYLLTHSSNIEVFTRCVIAEPYGVRVNINVFLGMCCGVADVVQGHTCLQFLVLAVHAAKVIREVVS